jgi:hypothetical protein
MDLVTATANLMKIQDPKKYADLEWKRLPPGIGFLPTEEMKAEIAARRENRERVEAELNAQREAMPELYAPLKESNTMYETNVTTLDEAATKGRISYITGLIQSGEAEKYSFRAGNGDQTTTSIHQILYWLQQRARDFDSDGTYSPEMFK